MTTVHRFDYHLEDIFKFEERDVTSYMTYELKLPAKFKEAFTYLTTKMKVQPLKALDKIKWDEGKNYDWAVIKSGEVTLLIRKYQSHFTIFYKKENQENKYNNRYGCFTYSTNRDKLSDKESDARVDNNFLDLEANINDIFKLIAEDKAHGLWNSYTLVRPKFVEVKTVWNGGDDISSIETFIFACDELFSKYLEIFAQTDMFDRIKTIKKGSVLNDKYKVLGVKTTLKDGYYHDIGLTLQGTNGATSESWYDVYALTRWYLKDIFTE